MGREIESYEDYSDTDEDDEIVVPRDVLGLGLLNVDPADLIRPGEFQTLHVQLMFLKRMIIRAYGFQAWLWMISDRGE